MIFVYFFLFSAAAALTYALAAARATVLGALGVFALGFLAANLLFAILFTVNSFFCRGGWPIEKQRPLSRWITVTVCEWLCGYAGMRPVLIGLEKLPEGTPFLFVCNHRSGFDPLLAISLLRRWNLMFVSKPSNMELPIAGVTAIAAGCLPIDRENDRAALRTILAAADYLRRGVCSIGIYPEGTRSRTGELGRFHAGSFKIAQKAGAPVAVCCVRGSERVRELPFLGRPRVELEVLELIDADTVKSMRTTELSDHARRLIEQAL